MNWLESWASSTAERRVVAASVFEEPLRPGSSIKDRQPNWKDTNMCFFGTAIERSIKEAAARTEPQWWEAGSRKGLQIWRIEQFKVVPWPESMTGQFHEADSYIVLHTYPELDDKLAYDIHFWIGTASSQDKYGTAAYKTVELDDYLHGAAVQHREVQHFESKLFLSYFQKGITYVAGGSESGFRHVEHVPRPTSLLWVKGLANDVRLSLVEPQRQTLNSGDVFVLDCEEGIFQWNGKDSNGYERAKAAEVCATMHAERGRSSVTVYDEGDAATFDPASPFCRHLPTGMKGLGMKRGVDIYGYDKSVCRAESGGRDEDVLAFEKVIHRLHVGEDGELSLELMAKGHIPCSHLSSEGVFVIDSGFAVFLWVGKQASLRERVAVFVSGRLYIQEAQRPECLPVTHYAEGQETHQFWRVFPDPPPLKHELKLSNNYDKYAMSYIDVDTNS